MGNPSLRLSEVLSYRDSLGWENERLLKWSYSYDQDGILGTKKPLKNLLEPKMSVWSEFGVGVFLAMLYICCDLNIVKTE